MTLLQLSKSRLNFRRKLRRCFKARRGTTGAAATTTTTVQATTSSQQGWPIATTTTALCAMATSPQQPNENWMESEICRGASLLWKPELLFRNRLRECSIVLTTVVVLSMRKILETHLQTRQLFRALVTIWTGSVNLSSREGFFKLKVVPVFWLILIMETNLIWQGNILRES